MIRLTHWLFHCTTVWAPKSYLTPRVKSTLTVLEKMSGTGKGKKREELDHASEDDTESHAPPKKTAKKDTEDDSGDIVFEIGKNRRVSVRTWNKQPWVDIREFYTKDGKQLPGKKGISLNMEQWIVLRDHIEEIDNAVKEKS
ncbi:putative transcription factor ssDNA-binding-TF family [Medicago truncatula]|nr:RNA polymerase II transcriptional coactivator KIWI isoform X1 [Medicago truncatula]RHN69975.1 putative transcription factor ssDNA-binding-TF family [Medicago truncatula]